MAQKTLVSYGDTNGVVQANDQAVNGSVVLRDSAGNVNAKGFTSSSNSVISAGGGLNLSFVTYTTTVTIVASAASVLLFDATAGAFPATLPPASASAGANFMIAKIDSTANLVTIQGSGSDAIQSPSGSANTYTGLSAQGKIGFLYCDGTKWRVGLLA